MSSASVVGIISTVLSVVPAIFQGHKCDGILRKAGPFITCECLSYVVFILRVPSSAGLCFVGTYSSHLQLSILHVVDWQYTVSVGCYCCMSNVAHLCCLFKV